MKSWHGVGLALGVPVAFIVMAVGLTSMAPAAQGPQVSAVATSASGAPSSDSRSMAAAPTSSAPASESSSADSSMDPSMGMSTDSMPAPTESSSEAPSESSSSDSSESSDSSADLSGQVTSSPRGEGASVQVHSHVETTDPVFFITIDDGMKRPDGALQYVEDNQIPVTAFLTEWTTPGHADYFNAFTQFGGTIGNHSMTHASYTDPKTDVNFEICNTQKVFTDRFGYRPFLLRPPYGNGYDNSDIQNIASSCGITDIIMWNVVVHDDGQQIDYIKPGLHAGDIVLLHFTDDIETALRHIMQVGADAGLHPAPLTDYL